MGHTVGSKTPDGVLQQPASFAVPAYEVAISQTA